MRTAPSLQAILRAAMAASAIALSPLLPESLTAQERAPAQGIISDRPGIGDGAWVLAPGVWQAELGITLQDVGPDRIGAGSALVRWGLSPLELRFYLPSPLFSVEPDGTELGDLGLGVKVPLSLGENWRWSVVGGATFPTGTDGGTADTSTGFATLVGETGLTEALGFTLNAGISSPFDDADLATFSVVPTLSTGLTETVSVYGGYAGFFQDGGDQHWIEGGLAGAAGPDLQWDINSAWDLENETWFLGIGLAKRWR